MHYTFSGKEKEVMGLNGKMIVVRQIQAIKDFTVQVYTIKAGSFGGWIQATENLPQESYGWIDKDSIVGEEAVVKDRAYLKASVLFGDIICEKESRISNSVIRNNVGSNPMLIRESHVLHSQFDSPELLNIQNCSLIDVEGYKSTYLKIREKVKVEKMLDPKLMLSGMVKFSECNTEDIIFGDNVSGVFHNVHLKGDIRLNGRFFMVHSSITNLNMSNSKKYEMNKVHFVSEKPGTLFNGCQWDNTTIITKDFYALKESTMNNVIFENVESLNIHAILHLQNVTWKSYDGEPCLLSFSGKQNEIMGDEETPIIIKVTRLSMSDTSIVGHAKISGYDYGFIEVSLSGFTTLISHYEKSLFVSKLTMKDCSSMRVDSSLDGNVYNLSLKDDEHVILKF